MRLPLPGVDSVALVSDVVAERRAGRNATYFDGIEEKWRVRTQAYIDAEGNPELVPPWPEITDHKEKFINLYGSPQDNSVQKPILDNLRSRTLQLCPACGEDGTPNTLDHYLPKDVYPEFSITPVNLFPMCDICQGEKGTKTLNAADERLFLHPYFDQFAEMQVLALEIGRPFEAPETISIVPHPLLTAPQAALVSRHLAELGIVRRYHRFFRDEYLRLFKLVNEMRQEGQDVRQSLGVFRNYARFKSVNSWGHVFFTGVLENADLLVYLETTHFPPFL